jgi:cell wall-associated NlpC family hydrolase
MPTVRKTLVSVPVILLTIFLLSAAVCAAAAKTGIITGDIVNLRANPNTTSKVLMQLEKGKQVSVLGSEGEWFKVSVNDETGWIRDDYLVIRDTVSSTGTVSGSVVNVRSKPDISSEVLAKLDKGTKVDIYERSGEWYRISIGEERFGWVNAEFLTVRGDTVSRGVTSELQVPAALTEEVEEEEADGGSVEQDSASDSGDDAAVDENTSDIRQQIVAYAKKFIGVKYVFGGSTPKGFDCSGFVSYVYKHFDMTLARASRDMGAAGTVVKKADLQPGDLVFFDTNGGLNAITHVGIYIGSGKFIHASSTSGSRKVKISNLNEAYYQKRLMGARDYLTK